MASGKDKPYVILFKSPKETNKDPYQELLTLNNIESMCIPVLKFQFETEELINKLKRSNNYSALVLTSQRSCEALKLCFEIIKVTWKTKILIKDFLTNNFNLI